MLEYHIGTYYAGLVPSRPYRFRLQIKLVVRTFQVAPCANATLHDTL